MDLKPHPKQIEALSSRAHFTIFGGAAGSGKSTTTLINPLRAVRVPGFTGMIFRRTTKELRGPGGLWEESKAVYAGTGGKYWESSMIWKWNTTDPNRPAMLQFAHMEHGHDRYAYQSKELAFIAFEEVTHFLPEQVWYMLSRNRTKAPGVTPWMFATCNPDPDSFIRELIDWWIDADGFPIPERSGVLRYFTQSSGSLEFVPEGWRDAKGHPARSLTFVPAKLTDNPSLLEADPEYEAILSQMPYVDAQRLLYGNWNIRDGESMFDKQQVVWVDALPMEGFRWVRAWDRGARDRTVRSDVDKTAGVLMGLGKRDGRDVIAIADVRTCQGTPADVEHLIRATADDDGPTVMIALEEEFGASGKEATHYYRTKVLQDRHVVASRPSGDKVARAKPWCALAEHGLVVAASRVRRELLFAMNAFPGGGRDVIDAISHGYAALAKSMNTTKPGVVAGRSARSKLKGMF
jgi:phage terminase large subunit-like protein